MLEVKAIVLVVVDCMKETEKGNQMTDNCRWLKHQQILDDILYAKLASDFYVDTVYAGELVFERLKEHALRTCGQFNNCKKILNSKLGDKEIRILGLKIERHEIPNFMKVGDFEFIYFTNFSLDELREKTQETYQKYCDFTKTEKDEHFSEK